MGKRSNKYSIRQRIEFISNINHCILNGGTGLIVGIRDSFGKEWWLIKSDNCVCNKTACDGLSESSFVSLDKYNEEKKECVCDIIDLCNIGCPSIRGENCRSKK